MTAFDPHGLMQLRRDLRRALSARISSAAVLGPLDVDLLVDSAKHYFGLRREIARARRECRPLTLASIESELAAQRRHTVRQAWQLGLIPRPASRPRFYGVALEDLHLSQLFGQRPDRSAAVRSTVGGEA